MTAIMMKLNFQGMQILMEELQQQERWAIYLMCQGKEMTDVVTKLNLTRIINVLCKKLNWIEEDMESDYNPNKENNKNVENAPNFQTQGNLTYFNAKLEESEDISAGPSKISKNSFEDQYVNKSPTVRESMKGLELEDKTSKIQETIHDCDKPFSCSQCDYKCSRSSHLKEHEFTHTRDKPFSCSHCDFKCSKSGNLKRHERTHTGDKPFSCAHCDYKSNQSGDVKRHERTHNGDKPFSCAHCDYKSKRSDDVKRHERIHNGDKSFSCTYCDKKFTRSTTLKKHESIHTLDILLATPSVTTNVQV